MQPLGQECWSSLITITRRLGWVATKVTVTTIMVSSNACEELVSQFYSGGVTSRIRVNQQDEVCGDKMLY